MSNIIEAQITVSEFSRARAAIAMANDGKTWRGMFKEEIQDDLESSRRYAAAITHRETGKLGDSHIWEYDSHRMKGQLFINPRIVFATGWTLRWPRIYGVYEHARGGSHAFYARTIAEHIPTILPSGLYARVKELPWP